MDADFLPPNYQWKTSFKRSELTSMDPQKTHGCASIPPEDPWMCMDVHPCYLWCFLGLDTSVCLLLANLEVVEMGLAQIAVTVSVIPAFVDVHCRLAHIAKAAVGRISLVARRKHHRILGLAVRLRLAVYLGGSRLIICLALFLGFAE